jgi:hypothetical protein
MADPTIDSTFEGPTTIASNAVGDQATAEDTLGFGPYVAAIAAFLTDPATQPPLTMSIEGEWGSGKSSFMLQLERAIHGPSRADVFIQKLPQSLGGLNANGSLWNAASSAWRQERPRITIRFNAWRHDKQDALWAAFALKFAKSLRKQIGTFRGWTGDICLFFKRLSGLRGWLELLLLFVSCLMLAGGAAGLYRFVATHKLDEVKNVVSILTASESKKHTEQGMAKQTKEPQKPDEANESTELSEPYEFLFSHGKWGALFALALAGFIKLYKQVKLPLSINLEKYLTKPDYQGRVDFIESFHDDFARLVSAYAKNKRIFVFVDDLDRCDVPRAAELMQAINLMIGDAGKLVFILGMDREKVAAGIAQKYKELLPFLPGFASSASAEVSQPGALYFGYSYLEKFIQLSFTLPVISDETSVRHFLSNISNQSVSSGSLTRLVNHWSARFKHSAQSEPQTRLNSEVGAVTAAANAVAQEKQVRYLRVKVGKESDRIFQVASMVGVIFENNPRKLKQFINTFRLALYLGSDQGLLDQEEGHNPVTPEQLGKFIAITLRFPDLRSRLLENLSLLSELEEGAQRFDPRNASGADAAHTSELVNDPLRKWLDQRGVKNVLLHGVNLGAKPFNREVYSLKNFPVIKLLSILPKVPEKPNKVVSAATGTITVTAQNKHTVISGPEVSTEPRLPLQTNKSDAVETGESESDPDGSQKASKEVSSTLEFIHDDKATAEKQKMASLKVGDQVAALGQSGRFEIMEIKGSIAKLKLLANKVDTGEPVELNYKIDVPISALMHLHTNEGGAEQTMVVVNLKVHQVARIEDAFGRIGDIASALRNVREEALAKDAQQKQKAPDNVMIPVKVELTLKQARTILDKFHPWIDAPSDRVIYMLVKNAIDGNERAAATVV